MSAVWVLALSVAVCLPLVAGGDRVSRSAFSSEALGGGVGLWGVGVTGLVV